MINQFVGTKFDVFASFWSKREMAPQVTEETSGAQVDPIDLWPKVLGWHYRTEKLPLDK